LLRGSCPLQSCWEANLASIRIPLLCFDCPVSKRAVAPAWCSWIPAAAPFSWMTLAKRAKPWM
jgi:hypothetical protein